MQVRVAMLSELPTKLPLTLKAYVLNKDEVNGLEQWHPADHVVTESVSGGEVQQTLLCNQGTPGGLRAPDTGEATGLLGGVEDFVFKGEYPICCQPALPEPHSVMCSQAHTWMYMYRFVPYMLRLTVRQLAGVQKFSDSHARF